MNDRQTRDMEVEAENETKLHAFLARLETDPSKYRTGAYTGKYTEYYGIPKSKLENETPVIDFASTEQYIIPTKNMELFTATLAEQRKELKKLQTGSSTKTSRSSSQRRTKKVTK